MPQERHFDRDRGDVCRRIVPKVDELASIPPQRAEDGLAKEDRPSARSRVEAKLLAQAHGAAQDEEPRAAPLLVGRDHADLLCGHERFEIQQEIRDKAAALGLAKSQARVAEKERLNRETQKLADKAQREALEKRAAAIIELKHNIDKNTLELKALNGKRAMREKKKKASSSIPSSIFKTLLRSQ